jgi:hypothetical protein
MREHLPPMLREPSPGLRGILTVIAAVALCAAYFIGNAASDSDASASLFTVMLGVIALASGYVGVGGLFNSRRTPISWFIPAVAGLYLAYQAGTVLLALVHGDINPNWGDRISAVGLIAVTIVSSLLYIRYGFKETFEPSSDTPSDL